jgi:hypothetical protein
LGTPAVADFTSPPEKGDITMKKWIDRARGRLKGNVDKMRGALKGIAYNAQMVAQTVAIFVRGVLNGQHRP